MHHSLVIALILMAAAIGGWLLGYTCARACTDGVRLFHCALGNFAAFWVFAALHIATIKTGGGLGPIPAIIAAALCPGVAAALILRAIADVIGRRVHPGRALAALALSVTPVSLGYWYLAHLFSVQWHNYHFAG